MTIFDDHFRRIGIGLLKNNFGEEVTYCKYDGQSRVITGIVDRNPPADFDGVEYVRSEEVTLTVANCKINGIASDELDVGGDFILVSKRKGSEPVRMAITTLDEDGGGTCVLRLR